MTKQLGNAGEQVIVTYLEKNGFHVISRNYQVRAGEIDIVATKGEYVIFVEVKARHSKYFPISQTVTWRKQQRIIKAAQHFILSNQLRDKVFRFDVATVLYRDNRQSIEYIPNAFIAGLMK